MDKKYIIISIFTLIGIIFLIVGINYKKWKIHYKTNPRKIIGKVIKDSLGESGMKIFSIICGVVFLFIALAISYPTLIKPHLPAKYFKKAGYVQLSGNDIWHSIPVKNAFSINRVEENITKISISNCYFDKVPPFIWNYKNLESLNLSNNDFEDLPIDKIKTIRPKKIILIGTPIKEETKKKIRELNIEVIDKRQVN